MANPSIYSPLPTETSIRLLHLQRGFDSGSICCRLAIYGISQAPEYEALSYVWGDPNPPQIIFVNGIRVIVNPNLFSALRQLRPVRFRREYQAHHGTTTDSPQNNHQWRELESRYKFIRRNDGQSRTKGPNERILWIDALCINQREDEERSHQVKLMASIYTGASRVVIWLGADRGLAMDALPIFDIALREYYSLRSEDNPRPWKKFYQHGRAGYPDFDDKGWKSLAYFYDKEWFERLWVIQEAVLPRSAIALVGNLEFDWDSIGDIAIFLLDSQFNLQFFTGDRADLPNLELNRIQSRMLAARRIQLTKKFRTDWCLIKASFMSECTLPVDRIYGILGLLDSIRVEPDYHKPAQEVFRSVIRQIIKTRRDLLILGRVDHPPGSISKDFSSWVPEWKRDQRSHLLNELIIPYNATGTELLQLLEHPDENCLCLYGISVGHVAACSSIMELEAASLENKAAAYKSITEFVDSFLGGAQGSEPCGHTNQDIDYVLANVLTAGYNFGSTTLFLDGKLELEVTRGLRSMIKKLSIGLDLSGPETLVKDMFEVTLEYVCRQRRLFTTSDGSLGIGPRAMETGDEIVILFGGITPFIIRSLVLENRGEKHRRCQFVGECYLYGVMNGETIESRGCNESTIFELV